jgi:cytidine deaminase
MTSEDIEALISLAEDAMKRAIAPYSGFKVGAALLCADGKTYTGCNIENPSLMLTACAERVALQSALSDGYTSFSAMAIVSNDERYCFPCGSCRQMLMEFAPDIQLYLRSKTGIKKFTIAELLPYPFSK